MNINDSSQIRKCTSCQLCGAVCPVGAISIKLDEYGFYRPVINGDVCINCGLCVKSCYKFDDSIAQSELSSKKLYAAWANDPEILGETTSGGIADILVRQLIQDGYKCIGVIYDSDRNCAVGDIASTKEEALKFRGSKYIQSLSVESFKTLVRSHKHEKFAVFGLPCQIYAIDRYLKLRGDRDRHVLIDLYCHGCPSLNVWNKYIDSALKKIGGKISYANFRSKVRGWGNFYNVKLLVERRDSTYQYVSPRINDSFYELFFSDLVLNDSCYDCKLRSSLEYSDIRLGDFWGKSYVSNHRGVSGVTVSSKIGSLLFNKIRGQITLEAQSFSNFLPYQSYGKNYSVDSENRIKLLSLLSDEKVTIKECVKAYHKMQSSKLKIKRLIKNIIKLMPNGFISTVKGMFYSLTNK